MNRRVLVAVVGWLVAAVAATTIGVAAVRLVGNDLTRQSGPATVEPSAPSAQPGPATTSAAPSPGAGTRPVPSPSASASSPASPASPTAASPRQQVFTTSGGSVVASCEGQAATLQWWSPAQGYAATHVTRGPAAEVEVEFEAEDLEDVEVKIRCQDGVPVLHHDD